MTASIRSLLLTLAAIVTTTHARAQGTPDRGAAPTAGATALRVHVATSPDSAYRRVVAALEAHGFEAERNDSVGHVLVTAWRREPGVGLVQVAITVLPDSAQRPLMRDAAVVRLGGTWRTCDGWRWSPPSAHRDPSATSRSRMDAMAGTRAQRGICWSTCLEPSRRTR